MTVPRIGEHLRLTAHLPSGWFSHRKPHVGGASLAVVLGDLDLVSSLGMAGINSVPVSAPDDPVRFSRFARGVVLSESQEPGDRLVARLTAFAARLRHRPVLYYQTDASLLFVSRNRSRLGQYFHAVLPEAELVEDLVNKRRFGRLADRLQLPVPETRVVPPLQPPAAALDLAFPVVVKPATREGLELLGYEGKATSFMAAADLLDSWPRLSRSGTELIVQELVGGPETAVESYHAYIDGHGHVAGEFTGAKVRTRPSTLGFSTAVQITAAADVAAEGRALVERLDVRGVVKVDYKRDPSGRLHLLEVNPRFSLWHHAGAAAGVNIPALVYADLVGLPRPASGPARPGVTWCHMGADRRAASDAGLSLTTWLAWVARTSARAEGRWSDPMPLVRGLLLPKMSKGFGGQRFGWRHPAGRS